MSPRMIPGEVFPAEGEIELNAGAEVTVITVANTGDRPVQVGSHYHFAETNPGLAFDRAARAASVSISRQVRPCVLNPAKHVKCV